ncbi:MAG: hypothetical protein AB7H92_07445 [Microbacteriaceae bacterium]
MTNDDRTRRLLEQWREGGGTDFTGVIHRMRSERDAMTPADMATAQASTISFADTLVTKMVAENWTFTLRHAHVDTEAAGVLAYDIVTPDSVMSFGVRSVFDPLSGERLGRLRENSFDLYGVLMEGPAHLPALETEHVEQLTKSWNGRSAGCLGWSFANRSGRLFGATIDALAARREPTLKELWAGGGYLVRNAGFYGNGRHGSRAWLTLPPGHALAHPYHVDLLALYMWKLASLDLVERAARARDARSVGIPLAVRQAVGVGNSSGIGTIATLVRWPTTLAAIALTSEMAWAHGAELLKSGGAGSRQRLAELIENALPGAADQASTDNGTESLPGLNLIRDEVLQGNPCRAIAAAAAERRDELGGVIASCLASLDGDFALSVTGLIDALMRRIPTVDPGMSVSAVLAIIQRRYTWVAELQKQGDVGREHFWYRSAENGENRRGERAVDPGVELETFVDVAGAIRSMTARLQASPPAMTIGEWLLSSPSDSSLVARVQLADQVPYTEIHGNLVAGHFVPADLIRYFLSSLGMRRLQPLSNQWLGGVFLADSPAQVTESLDLPGVDPQARPADDAEVTLGYPELRRILPDALRVHGVPAGLTAEAAELLTWTEASTGLGIGILLGEGPALPGSVHLVAHGRIDLLGGSLAVYGTRICDYVRTLPEGSEIVIEDCTDAEAVIFMARYLAMNGLAVTASCDAFADTASPENLLAVASAPGPEPRTPRIRYRLATPQRAGTRHVTCRIALTSRAEGVEIDASPGWTDLSDAYEQAIRSGIPVPMERYLALRAVVARLRVPASERSTLQAG